MPQLQLSPAEIQNLATQIRIDYDSAQSEHSTRMKRWNEMYRRLMMILEQSGADTRGNDNSEVPAMLWTVLEHIAAEHQAIFAPDAYIDGSPRGDADVKLAGVVAAGMNWLVYSAVDLDRKWPRFAFYRSFFGRGFAYRPYEVRTFEGIRADGSFGEVVAYNAPEFYPIWPDNLILPAEEFQSLQEASFVIHREFLTLPELVRGEQAGRFFGISENYAKLTAFARNRNMRNNVGQEMTRSRDLVEGVNMDNISLRNGRIEVWSWYGRWHMPLPDEFGEMRDYAIDDWEHRDLLPEDLLVRYIPDANMVIGVESLKEMYPCLERRRPFFESALNDSLSYWGPGYGQLLYDIQAGLTQDNRDMAECAKRNAIKTGFMRQTSSMSPDSRIEIEPGKAYFTQDPAAIRWEATGGSMDGLLANEQRKFAISERLTGRSDLNSGRTIDRPNAPKTVGQTMALLEAGNVRLAYDTSKINQDLNFLFQDYWQMWSWFGGEQLNFRVTERDLPRKMFKAIGDLNAVEQAARNMQFDFAVRFAPTEFRRAALRENMINLLGLALKNPVVMSSPRALWNITRKVHELMGDRDFADLVPEPPDIGIPKNPMAEWAMMQQGEIVNVHPQDDDKAHIADHMQRLEAEMQSSSPDQDLIRAAMEHIQQHQQQMELKAKVEPVAQALGAAAAQSLQQQQQAGQGRPGEQPQREDRPR